MIILNDFSFCKIRDSSNNKTLLIKHLKKFTSKTIWAFAR